MMDKRHTLEFYCLDYWARYTGLEILPLHHELSHLIQYRPGAESFLRLAGTASAFAGFLSPTPTATASP